LGVSRQKEAYLPIGTFEYEGLAIGNLILGGIVGIDVISAAACNGPPVTQCLDKPDVQGKLH
jgi:hypothetical protein